MYWKYHVTIFCFFLGLLSLMYALLHNSGAARISPSPFPLSEGTITILTSVLRLVNFTALLDINALQVRQQSYSDFCFNRSTGVPETLPENCLCFQPRLNFESQCKSVFCAGYKLMR